MVISGTLLGLRSPLASKRFRSDGNPSQPVRLLFCLEVYVVYLCYSLPRSGIPAEAGPIVQAPTPENQTSKAVATLQATLLSSHPVLQQLRDLDKSSSEFHIQLSSVLYGDEYIRCVTNLRGDSLAWLVEFLDDVCHCSVCPYSHLCRRRLLTVSQLPVLLSESVYVNSGAYAELR